MSIDFDNLPRPKTSVAPIDPFEIFAKTPNVKGALPDLWRGQAEALKLWHANRHAQDNVILLNTGAGKTIVGVLIAQSLVNESIGPVVFVCSTIDLVEQTARECDRLGIKYTKRTGGEFSNDLFQTGKAFCITTYHALYNAKSAFSTENKPSGIVFDDAHVAERIIRDTFTLSIEKQKFPDIYNEIVEIVRPDFEKLNKGSQLDSILEQVGQQRVTMCPPATASKCRKQIIQAISKAKDWKNTELFFPTLQLWENIDKCAIFISANAIEITPPFIPTGVYDFLGKGVRKVYLSATMEFETDFVRGFGRRMPKKIMPDNDAGNGERLILLSSRFDPPIDKKELADAILKDHKLLISVPSYPRAVQWKDLATPPKRSEFTDKLQEFRSATSGAFVLVSRIDGIDLPQDACRVMLIDGIPAGASLMDNYLFHNLSLLNLYSTKMAGRITQLLGRINRGRSDYGAFVIYGQDINVWLKTERNLALLPPLIRKQVILSETVQEGMKETKAADIADLISKVIGREKRDEGWMKFYRETVDGLEVSTEALERVKERETQLAKSAVAECEFMTKLWQGDIDAARKALFDVLDDTALADAKLAGWYSLWLGATYEAEGDKETAIAYYKKARSRLSPRLNVPFKSEFDKKSDAEGEKTRLQAALLEANDHGPLAFGNLIAKLKTQARILTENSSSGAKEEAVRRFGELMGFAASRPDNEYGHGPDVVWLDDQSKYGIAFELKTEKKAPAEYNKQEVGQALNHLVWLNDNMEEFQWEGLLLVGPDGICKPEASPSGNIFLVDTMVLVRRMHDLVAKLDDTRGSNALDRRTLLNELGSLAEWQLSGWFKALAVKPLKNAR